MEIIDKMRGVLGIVVILGFSWLLSNNKRKIPWRILAWGIGLQLLFALIIMKTGPGEAVFDWLRHGFARLLSFSHAGGVFLFGSLYKGIDSTPPGAPGWRLQLLGDGSNPVSLGFVMAFHVLPVIIFFSSLTQILYHLNIMQWVVRGFAWVMQRTMKISGAESLAVASNVFVGMVESPLAVKPYVASMTLSELNLLMTAGFATIAGSVMASYVMFGVDPGHLIAASVMSAPAAVVVAKLMFPETETPQTLGTVNIKVEKTSVNVIDAAASGAIQGLKIAAVVGAMLIAFLSLIAMINYLLGFVDLSLGRILGWVFTPVAWCIGVDTVDTLDVASLLGKKVAVNELVAYLDLVSIKDQISARSYTIATYALCGFANFGSVAILLGGVGALAPERRQDLARLGLKTMLGGALASWLTASIAGLMI